MLLNIQMFLIHKEGGARIPLAVLFATALLLSVACGSEPTPSATPAATPTPTPEPLVFLPEDEAPHDAPVEWWYFNGMLTDDAGGEYSYHFVTFQSPGPQGVVPHLLQASLADHVRGVHYTAEQPVLSPENPDARNVDVKTGGWLMRGDGTGYEMRMEFSGAEGAVELELTAVPQREAVLHGGTGLVHMGPEAGSTYYYSRTRLDVGGWIDEAGNRRPVSGPGWMDHQWGEIASDRVGWDWTSVQLDDGADVMAAVIWHPEGKRRLGAHGTYIAPDGAVSYFEEDDISITAQGSWTSPGSGVEYTSGWSLEILPIELQLELSPYLAQAEFDSDVLGVAYWEGAASAVGNRGGQPVSGWAFVELAGYDPRRLEVTTPEPTARP